jgi:dTDP-4-dehydrorhamnose 3,5-epimerase
MMEMATFYPLRRINHPNGDIFHGLRKSDSGYIGFGEAYFTTIHFGDTKGWKKHRIMQMNLIVPLGNVRFYVFNEKRNKTEIYNIGTKNYGRLVIPPGLWVAFTGLDVDANLILNIGSIEHDPVESENAEIFKFPLLG